MLKYDSAETKLLGNLESGIGQVRWREIFAETGIDENSRAEALSAGEWPDLLRGKYGLPERRGEATEN